jgi:glutathione S-transferase
MIDLYTAPTPNGWEASITLEELEMPYEVHVVNLLAGDQKQPEFLQLNPNGKIPTIVDRDEGDLEDDEGAQEFAKAARTLVQR